MMYYPSLITELNKGDNSHSTGTYFYILGATYKLQSIFVSFLLL